MDTHRLTSHTAATHSFYSLLQSSGADQGSGSGEAASGQQAVRDALWGFLWIVAPTLVLHPSAKFIRSHWVLQWRLVLMKSYFAQIDPQRVPIEGMSQRLHEDTQRFSRGCESVVVVLLDSFATLVVFLPLLTHLSGEVVPPNWLVWCRGNWLALTAFVASVVSIAVSALIARPLLQLEVKNQIAEASLRKALVLLEASPASECRRVAPRFDGADPGRMPTLAKPNFYWLWEEIRANYAALYRCFMGLNVWLTSFDQVLVILPYALVGPLLFAVGDHRVKMGTLVRVSDCFGKVFGALSVVSESWVEINAFASAIIRLGQFECNLLQQSTAERLTATLVQLGTELSHSPPDRPPSPVLTDPQPPTPKHCD